MNLTDIGGVYKFYATKIIIKIVIKNINLQKHLIRSTSQNDNNRISKTLVLFTTLKWKDNIVLFFSCCF